MVELQIHFNDDDFDIQDDFEDLEAIIDDSESNTDQNFRYYIDQKEEMHKKQMSAMKQLLENNL